MKSCFALIDCNNFYAACETLFRPDLKGRPIIVLSNNDGCVIARSQEAKHLGIKMAEPVFKIKQLVKDQDVVVFSSNYPLYANISQRVMQVIESIVPNVEIYSIDEAFLDLTGIEPDKLASLANHLVKTVYQLTGIKTCVGIGPTKTLAKLANHAAKKYAATKSVVVLLEKERQKKLMHITAVDDVWGVGKRLLEKLKDLKIYTALDLSLANYALLRKKFSVTLERTARELNGQQSLSLEKVSQPKKQIICSRSFGQSIMSLTELNEAISEYAARACEKLRSQHQCTKYVSVFIRTNSFKVQNSYANSATGMLIEPSFDTRVITKKSIQLLHLIWRNGYYYSKAGVVLFDFYHLQNFQCDLFGHTKFNQNSQSSKLMEVIDKINSKKKCIFLGSEGIAKKHAMKQCCRSPSYTTSWNSLPVVF